jgi:hypothetical protein
MFTIEGCKIDRADYSYLSGRYTIRVESGHPAQIENALWNPRQEPVHIDTRIPRRESRVIVQIRAADGFKQQAGESFLGGAYCAARGGRQRSSPAGGAAYGMPL